MVVLGRGAVSLERGTAVHLRRSELGAGALLIQVLSPGSQGQNLALTVLCVPNSLDSGIAVHTATRGLNEQLKPSSGSNVIPRRARPGLGLTLLPS